MLKAIEELNLVVVEEETKACTCSFNTNPVATVSQRAVKRRSILKNNWNNWNSSGQEVVVAVVDLWSVSGYVPTFLSRGWWYDGEKGWKYDRVTNSASWLPWCLRVRPLELYVRDEPMTSSQKNSIRFDVKFDFSSMRTCPDFPANDKLGSRRGQMACFCGHLNDVTLPTLLIGSWSMLRRPSDSGYFWSIDGLISPQARRVQTNGRVHCPFCHCLWEKTYYLNFSSTVMGVEAAFAVCKRNSTSG